MHFENHTSEFLLRAPIFKFLCKSASLQHLIIMQHIINLRKMQKIKVITTTSNQNEKVRKWPENNLGGLCVAGMTLRFGCHNPSQNLFLISKSCF
jgi:hypothetical protein